MGAFTNYSSVAVGALLIAIIALLVSVNDVEGRYYDVNEDYYCEKWAEWSHCTASCGGGEQKRARKCQWKEYDFESSRTFTQTMTVHCGTAKCPAMSAWTTWSKCSATCGHGTATRDRHCENAKDGVGCKGATGESRACRLSVCVYWETWTKWTECTVSCGGGLEVRKRSCHGSKPGHPSCKGTTLEDRNCQEFFCPYWSNWSAWSACDASCGSGHAMMTRTCVKDPAGEAACVGSDHKTRECNERACSTWNAWTEWTACDATCGDGHRTRDRTCTHVDGTAGVCDGEAVQTTGCTLTACPRWSNWDAWSACSARCGGGLMDRLRHCVVVADSGMTCEGSAREDKPCALFVCPYWGEWTTWSACSGTCGSGVERKTRQCISDPSSHLECDGSAQETRSCSHPACPFWHAWSKWSACDATCDGGKKQRDRQCERLNNFDCQGQSNETLICAPFPCPVWGNWSAWTPCDASCDGGITQKTRECQMDPASGFHCDGSATDVQECGQIPCRECIPSLIACDFEDGLCNYTASSASPLRFFFRHNVKGLAETYAPFPHVGDWTELRSVVFRECMIGPWCLSMHYLAGGVTDEQSKSAILLRTPETGLEEMAWSRASQPIGQGHTPRFNVNLRAGQQVVIRVSKDTPSFEFFWLYDINATRGHCQ